MEKSPRDEVTLNYDSMNPFVICAIDFVPIYRGSPALTCSYCSASYSPAHKSKVCVVCEVGQVGGVGSGLRLMV